MRCDACATDLLDGICPAGHETPDPSLVVPVGASRDGVVQPQAPARAIRLVVPPDASGPTPEVPVEPGTQGPQGTSVEPVASRIASVAPDAPEVRAPAADGEDMASELGGEMFQALGVLRDLDDPPAAPTAATGSTDPGVEAEDQGSVLEHLLGIQSAEIGADAETAPEVVGSEDRAPATEDATPADADASASQQHSVYGGVELFGKPQRGGARRSRRRLFALPLIVAVLCSAGAFVVFGGGSAEAAVYQRAFAVGESYTYTFRMTMAGGSSAGPIVEREHLEVVLTMTERTIDVDVHGNATVLHAFEDVRFLMDGKPVPVPLDEMTLTLRIAPDGRVLDAEGLGALAFGQAGPAGDLMGPGSMGPLLPNRAVAPGDSWVVTEQMPHPLVDEPIEMTARNRLVERSVENGVEVAVIRSNLNVPMDMRVPMRRLLQMMEEETGETLPGGSFLPARAIYVYEGAMTMDLVQTVEVRSGRPLRVVGSGGMDLDMRIEGMRGMPDMKITMEISVSMHEIGRTGGPSQLSA